MSEEFGLVDCTKCALTLADHMSLVSSLLELGRQQPVYTMGYNGLPARARLRIMEENTYVICSGK